MIPKKIDTIIKTCLQTEGLWGFSNDILYNICKEYPSNTEKQSVLAKTLIIGRVYAASLERGKGNTNIKGDRFYSNNVFPLVKSFFKENVGSLQKAANKEDFPAAISLHGKFVKSLFKLRKSNKTSFASKYLHFHYPDIFYIYDSRAKKAIQVLNKHFNNNRKLGSIDRIKTTSSSDEYLNFVSKCEILRYKLQDEYRRKISLRKFDTILISIAGITK